MSLSNSDLASIALYPQGLVRYWRVLRKLIRPDLVNIGDTAVIKLLENPPKGRAEEFLIRILTAEDRILPLAKGPLQFLSHYDLAVQINEIFVHDHYGFTAPQGRKSIRIIDAGANIGLAILKFKTQHPSARITAIEPNPSSVAVLQANIAAFGLRDVEIVSAALGAKSGEATVHIDRTMPMASSLTPRMLDSGHEIESCTVQCIAVDSFIDEEVDFFKLDIEGAEYEVLSAIGTRMNKIRLLFCEFHFGAGISKSFLTQSLHLLDQNGFDWIITKAQDDWRKPLMMENLGRSWGASLNVWARQTSYDEEEHHLSHPRTAESRASS